MHAASAFTRGTRHAARRCSKLTAMRKVEPSLTTRDDFTTLGDVSGRLESQRDLASRLDRLHAVGDEPRLAVAKRGQVPHRAEDVGAEAEGRRATGQIPERAADGGALERLRRSRDRSSPPPRLARPVRRSACGETRAGWKRRRFAWRAPSSETFRGPASPCAAGLLPPCIGNLDPLEGPLQRNRCFSRSCLHIPTCLPDFTPLLAFAASATSRREPPAPSIQGEPAG